MSTIKSSSDHVIINADGASKDIKFQANGVEKASISSAGAFTSTTIDATALTGTIPNFTSTGIDDNATSTAITIDSSERVSLTSDGSSASTLSETDTEAGLKINANNTSGSDHINFGAIGSAGEQYIQVTNGGGTTGYPLRINPYDSDVILCNTLTVKNDGRGLSEFTAKAWINFNGTGTVAIRDSHNVSSITDNGTGDYSANFTNALANVNYCSAGLAANDGEFLSHRGGIAQNSVNKVRVAHKTTSNSYVDGSLVTILVFGD